MKYLFLGHFLSYLLSILFLLTSCYKTQYSILYTDLENSDVKMITDTLRSEKIDFQVKKIKNTFTLLVPESKQYDLRIFLAQKNLPKMKGLILDYSQNNGIYDSHYHLIGKDFHCLKKTNIPLYFNNLFYKRQYALTIQKHLEIMTKNTSELIFVKFDPISAKDLADETFKIKVILKFQKKNTLSTSKIKLIKNFILFNVPCSSDNNIILSNSQGLELI